VNAAAKDFVPKQRAFIYQDETLSALRPYVSAQSLPVGPVPLGNVNTSMVQSNSIALETSKGLSTAIREGITLPKRNLPTFDGNPLHYYGFLKLWGDSNEASLRHRFTTCVPYMCRGKAYEATRSCNIISPPSEALNGSWQTFYEAWEKTCGG